MEYGFTDILQLLGALGLFLFGMKVMSDALMSLAGDKMRRILASMTSNRVLAVLTGFLITAVIQSSSATTLMVVSFVNASLLTLTEAIGVILGAHIGTTITAWLITLLGFKVSMSTIALPLVGLGFLMTFSKKAGNQYFGTFIIGFAVLFIGLQFLKDAVPDLKSNPAMLAWVQQYTHLGFWSVLLFLAIGTFLTLIVQSSSATMALTLVMCHEGWIPLDMAAAMVLGENIGTTITANLAAIVANYQAKRAARAHFISQTIGVVIMLFLLYPFLRLIDTITQSNGVSAFDSPLAIPVALSAFHTAFNIFNTLILIWFIPLIVKIVTRMVPYKAAPAKEVDEPKFLTEKMLKYPETLIASLENESKYLYENAIFEIITHALNVHREDIKSDLKIKKIVKHSKEDLKTDVGELYYTKVKNIYGEIIRYATKGQSELSLTQAQTAHILELKVANRKMVEIVKDVQDLSKNVKAYFNSENKYISKEYDKFRKKIVKVLRVIYLYRTEENAEKHLNKLQELKEEAKKGIHQTNESINRLIRENLITVDMGSSLVNDNDYVNDIVENLITIAELLYEEKDSLLDTKKYEKEAV
jgi:phosphate:Na+ symporter